MQLKRRLAALVLSGIAVAASTLVAGTGAQADLGSRVGTATWGGYPQNIITYSSNKCLQPKSLAPNALIEQRSCNGSSIQKWRPVDAGNGFTRLVNVASGQCMDLVVNSEAEVVPGVLVQQFYCAPEYISEEFGRSHGSRLNHFQVWTRVRTTICIEVKNGSTSNGALIWINGCDYYRTSQQFRFLDAH